jgi:hypothetical protein
MIELDQSLSGLNCGRNTGLGLMQSRVAIQIRLLKPGGRYCALENRSEIESVMGVMSGRKFSR